MESRNGELELRSLRHDLRAPIANVIALAELSMHALEHEENQAQILPYLSRILLAARELAQMTAEADEEGKAQRFTAFDLAQTLGATIGEAAAKKNQLLRIDVSGLGSGAMEGDRAALVRALSNLLSNAVKYTPAGGHIRLTARQTPEGCAEFVVTDDGMGMDAEFMQRLFEPYARAKEAQEKGIPGQGLGLSIVRRMVRRLGGEICAKSEPGKGTTFTLRAPLKREEEGKRLAGMHFLLAEDNDLSAEIAMAILNAQGAKVRRAEDGKEAAALFLSSCGGTYDAVLMDMRMPGMDGCAAARMIRQSAREDAKRIPILALTAGGGRKDEEEAMAAGMDGCLAKPLNVGELCRKIRMPSKGLR